MGDSIGQRIKAKRLELKLTQNQVAEKLFVTQQTVARWENGKHTFCGS
ncbi:helix-turn-helix transcriptional regulator [Lactiplantibacillus plantarum]|nr:helix-turn-helix transcriptional regulator [Lactiplantibacillus plantarum]MCG0912072.1 XRE family transcriptional regulator [Lactiplantibacillus plantarum]WDT50533.1 helix-turn-helix domain-containing protein [Lactiplantibacillus plantarum]